MLLLTSLSLLAQGSIVVEDGESGNTSLWRVTDSSPAGYSVENKEENGNRFISLRGTARKNAFMIGNRTARANALGIENHHRASWQMRTNSPWLVLFAADTSDGLRLLMYSSAVPREPNGSDRQVRTGLGSLRNDGTWHLFNRDLQADLQQAQPGNSIVSINGLVVRGSIDIDNLVFHSNPPDGPEPDGELSAVEAARLLTQATFGPTLEDIAQVQNLGIEAWLDRQFTLSGESHLAYVQQYSNGSGRAPRHEIWWKSAVDGEDQLRQRVAFALSQLFVVSDTGYTLANAQYGISAYYQMLLDNAFGNYRQLLENVTLHAVMGIYLSMLQNGKGDREAFTRPDENYAREVLQLFSIGLHTLDNDGSTDGSPVFTQDHVEAFARVFTGWNYSDAGRWDRPLFTGADMISPMEPFEDYHDTGEKLLLNGEVVPAGLSARADLERALDNIFNHSNVGPFVVTQLIKRLVSSNPSRQYVRDIAAVFDDDGTGTRGNLQAVIRALLLHDEARSIPEITGYGKLREPVLRLSHLWRAFGVLPGSQSSTERNEYNTASPQLMDLELATGQAPLKSPSVFNFFQPTFAPAGPVARQNLKAPEFELFTESNELATSNRIGRQIQQYSSASISDGEHPVSYLDLGYELQLAFDVDALLAHLDVVLLAGNMSIELRDVLSSHLRALPDTQPGRLSRVRDALTLIMASPDYLVQM